MKIEEEKMDKEITEQQFVESQFVVFQPYEDPTLSKEENYKYLNHFHLYQLSNMNICITKQVDMSSRKKMEVIEMAFAIDHYYKGEEDRVIRFLIADSV